MKTKTPQRSGRNSALFALIPLSAHSFFSLLATLNIEDHSRSIYAQPSILDWAATSILFFVIGLGLAFWIVFTYREVANGVRAFFSRRNRDAKEVNSGEPNNRPIFFSATAIRGYAALLGSIGVLWLAVYFFSTKEQQHFYTPDDTSYINEFLQELSEDLNKTLPRMVDIGTRLDTTMAGPGNRFQFYYTLAEVQGGAQAEEIFNRELVPVLRYRAISSGYLDDLFWDGAVVSFYYAGYDGERVGTITITPEEAGFSLEDILAKLKRSQ